MDTYATALAVLFVLHLVEEQVWPGGFRRWWNLTLWRTGDENFPLSRMVNLLRNTIGLGIAGVGLAVLGSFVMPHFLIVLIGFMLTDAILHLALSIFRKAYSPGAWTSPLYIIASLWALEALDSQMTSGFRCLFLAIGSAALLIVYLESYIKIRVRKSRVS